MKNFKLKRLLSLATVGLLTALHMPTVFAAAGDPIGNRATLTFDVGGAATILESSLAGNTTTGATNGSDTVFTEDRVINFTVATVDVATVSVAPSATLQVQTFTVTNNGNGPQDFLLAAINSAGGNDPFPPNNPDTFDPVLVQVFVDDGVPGYIQADDTDIFIDELAVGASRTAYIVSTIPSAALPLVNGDISVLALVAQIAEGGAASGNDAIIANAGAEITNDDNNNVSPAGTFGTAPETRTTVAGTPVDAGDIITGVGSEQIVFNDPAGATAVDVDSAGVQDVARNGQHADASSYTVAAAILTVRKESLALWDPVNGNSNPKAIMGAYVQYTITVSNDLLAGSSGDLTILSDTLLLTGLDPNLILATASTPVPGVVVGTDIENAVGDSIRIDTTGTGRTVPAAGLFYCTQAADADGCDHAGGVGNALTVDFTVIAAMPVEGATYTAGELKAGESVVIVFNAIVQ